MTTASCPPPTHTHTHTLPPSPPLPPTQNTHARTRTHTHLLDQQGCHYCLLVLLDGDWVVEVQVGQDGGHGGGNVRGLHKVGQDGQGLPQGH